MKISNNGLSFLRHPIRKRGCCAECVCQRPLALPGRRQLSSVPTSGSSIWRNSRRSDRSSSHYRHEPASVYGLEGICAQSARRYASKASSPPDIAVLGGGITGLATAFFLTEKLPEAKITIYEGREHFGGWLKSKAVDVGDGEVIFESGPRSLRPQPPNGYLTLDLVRS